MSRRKIWAATILLLGITTLPLLVASFGDRQYVFGGFLFNPNDGNSYLAKMLQGYNGSWRFVLPYTAEPGQGAYLFLFYLALGHLACLLHLSPILVFHLARVLATLLLGLALARFYTRVFGDHPRLAWYALLLSLFGSGLGWLVVLVGSFASDMWVAEAYPFLSAYANPHFPLGLALILAILLRLLAPLDLSGRLWLALYGLLLSCIMPFGVVVLAVVCAVWFAWTWFDARRLPFADLLTLACLFTLGGAYLLYQYIATLRDPVLAGWNMQNVTTSPPLWDVLVSFSPALLFGLLALPDLWKNRADPARRLLLTWFLTGILLIYIPFSLQRRFMLGFYIPVAACGVLGMANLARGRIRLGRLYTTVLILSLLTNAGVLLAGWVGIQTRDPLYYLAANENDALRWLSQNAPARALVLASPQTGLFIPAHTGLRVIYGHPFETVHALQEQAALEDFFSSGTIATARAFLAQRRVDYIFYGPREKTLGHPPILAELQPVFTRPGVTIYRLEPAP